MKEWLSDVGGICPDEPTCAECGRICKRTEVVWTGDDSSYNGFELWCYCDHCKVDTFHRMVSLEEYERMERMSES